MRALRISLLRFPSLLPYCRLVIGRISRVVRLRKSVVLQWHGGREGLTKAKKEVVRKVRDENS